MVALNPPVCDFGQPAVDFALPGTNGRQHTLADCRGPNGLLVMFICNHCPYVQAIIDRLIRDCRELAGHGIGSVAIMSNDVVAYPADSPEEMRRWAVELGFPFPYLHDASQQVARAYGAVCTPDFFGYNAALRLQYRGRLDASGRAPAAADAPRELFRAMCQIAASGQGPAVQQASIGCSIKWRE
ncbi:thioredoxin family protein [Azonexus sp.]|jgi:peroxiredoxin|uniref:thioredoxin family protein n=1 Tax=Azonexus sp. TaxID=1872668 RepID=UPI002825287B|nr:thioredoxin family protein [Azonexus sp.]MDR1996089.1 thioredoxin family protein [Azonexus sp.]